VTGETGFAEKRSAGHGHRDKPLNIYVHSWTRHGLYLSILYEMFKNTVLRTARGLSRSSQTCLLSKRYAHTPVAFNWEDPLNSASLFTEEELAIQETARSYCQERMLPRVLGESIAVRPNKHY
jgi:hypothetical protein